MYHKQSHKHHSLVLNPRWAMLTLVSTPPSQHVTRWRGPISYAVSLKECRRCLKRKYTSIKNYPPFFAPGLRICMYAKWKIERVELLVLQAPATINISINRWWVVEKQQQEQKKEQRCHSFLMSINGNIMTRGSGCDVWRATREML